MSNCDCDCDSLAGHQHLYQHLCRHRNCTAKSVSSRLERTRKTKTNSKTKMRGGNDCVRTVRALTILAAATVVLGCTQTLPLAHSFAPAASPARRGIRIQSYHPQSQPKPLDGADIDGFPLQISNSGPSPRTRTTSVKLSTATSTETLPTATETSPPSSGRASKQRSKNRQGMVTKTRKKKSPRPGPIAQRSEMMDHEILTREQDFDLGHKIQRAQQLKQQIFGYVETKLFQERRPLDSHNHHSHQDQEPVDEALLYASGTIEETHLQEDLHNLSVHTYTHASTSTYMSSLDTGTGTGTVFGVPSTQFQYHYDSTVRDQHSDSPFSSDDDDAPVSTRSLYDLHHSQNQERLKVYQYASRRQVAEQDFMDYTCSHLSDNDIINGLQIPGGSTELESIIAQGAIAKNTLISSNIRLVVSIAKKWLRAFDGYGGDNLLSQLYAGSSTRPSLDEAVQEGIVGLTKAADRYDPSRKLRFSTYATFYITNQVRIAFQQASTNGLRVPAPYHDIKAKYKRILRQCLESNSPVPSEEDMAKQAGITLNRLRKALVYTRPCISLDQPQSTTGPTRGSSAGEGTGFPQQISLADLMECQDERNHPEKQVELSLLRQCLETAMACELSPHERDILRLRLGLDDGVTRTARQVKELLGGSCSIPDIRNAEKRAYLKLSSPIATHTRQLMSYLDFCGADLETIR